MSINNSIVYWLYVDISLSIQISIRFPDQLFHPLSVSPKIFSLNHSLLSLLWIIATPSLSFTMSGYSLYNYTPSLAAAIIFLLLFVFLICGHIFFVWKHKTIFFITFVVGGLFEAIGYAARAVNAHEAPNYSTMPYALQSLFILLAPSLFAASIYMILGRIIRLVDGDSRSLIRATRLTKIFVLGDVLSFFIQSGGKKCYIALTQGINY